MELSVRMRESLLAYVRQSTQRGIPFAHALAIAAGDSGIPVEVLRREIVESRGPG